MRKWRPSFRCLYVISEIHGNNNSLQFILNRIFPLRKFKEQQDLCVFLGDYIDGDNGSAEVIDTLINIKSEYPDRVVFLKGNHEELLLRAINGSDREYEDWLSNKGSSTILSYLNKCGLNNTSPFSIPKNRLKDIIPKEHIEFLSSLKNYHIKDEFMFFHGSFDHNKSISENSESNFIFDRTASRYVKKCVEDKISPEFKDNYIYVGAHNYNEKEPFIHQKYIMLGGSAPDEIILAELNSMEVSRIRRGKTHIYPIINLKMHE